MKGKIFLCAVICIAVIFARPVFANWMPTPGEIEQMNQAAGAYWWWQEEQKKKQQQQEQWQQQQKQWQFEAGQREAQRSASKTPLMKAAIEGNMSEVSRLINSGADVNTKDYDDDTALNYALKSEHDNKNAIVKMLLDTKKFSKDTLNSALLETISYGTNSGIIRMMKEAGADINHKDNDNYGATLLMKSVKISNANPDFVQDLINMGANVNARNNYGETPLMYACGYYSGVNASVVKVLLDAGAYVNTSDNYGETPLMYAAKYGTPQVVGMILNAGANVNAKDKEGRKAVDYAKPAYFGWSGGNSRLKDSPVFKRLGDSDLWLKSIW